MTTENTHLNDLLQICDLTALIKEPTGYHLKLISTIIIPFLKDHPRKRFIGLVKSLATIVSVML